MRGLLCHATLWRQHDATLCALCCGGGSRQGEGWTQGLPPYRGTALENFLALFLSFSFSPCLSPSPPPLPPSLPPSILIPTSVPSLTLTLLSFSFSSLFSSIRYIFSPLPLSYHSSTFIILFGIPLHPLTTSPSPSLSPSPPPPPLPVRLPLRCCPSASSASRPR